MGARQVWVLVVAAAFLIAMGNTSADECQDVGVRVRPITFVLDSPAESNEPGVRLNASVGVNASVEALNLTVVSMGPSGSRAHVCFTLDIAPPAATPAPVPRPPPEPKWPTVTSLTADILSPSAVHVYWTTNLPTVGRVIWGPWGHERTGTADSERFGTAHGVWLLDLRAGETYSPHVIVFDGKAQAELSDEVVFTMPMPARDHGADAVLVAILAASTLGVCDVLRRSTK